MESKYSCCSSSGAIVSSLPPMIMMGISMSTRLSERRPPPGRRHRQRGRETAVASRQAERVEAAEGMTAHPHPAGVQGVVEQRSRVCAAGQQRFQDEGDVVGAVEVGVEEGRRVRAGEAVGDRVAGMRRRHDDEAVAGEMAGVVGRLIGRAAAPVGEHDDGEGQVVARQPSRL